MAGNYKVPGGVGGGGGGTTADVPNSRRIDTTSPLMGGGDLSADRVFYIDTATLLADVPSLSGTNTFTGTNYFTGPTYYSVAPGTPVSFDDIAWRSRVNFFSQAQTFGATVVVSGGTYAGSLDGSARYLPSGEIQGGDPNAALRNADNYYSGINVFGDNITVSGAIKQVSVRGATAAVVPYETTVYLAGGVVTVTGLCPLGGVIKGVVGYLSSGISGATLWELGMERAQDVWGRGLAVAEGTRTTHRDWRVRSLPIVTGPTNFTITASGAGAVSFTAGAVCVTSFIEETNGAAA